MTTSALLQRRRRMHVKDLSLSSQPEMTLAANKHQQCLNETRSSARISSSCLEDSLALQNMESSNTGFVNPTKPELPPRPAIDQPIVYTGLVETLNYNIVISSRDTSNEPKNRSWLPREGSKKVSLCSSVLWFCQSHFRSHGIKRSRYPSPPGSRGEGNGARIASNFGS